MMTARTHTIKAMIAISHIQEKKIENRTTTQSEVKQASGLAELEKKRYHARDRPCIKQDQVMRPLRIRMGAC